MAPHLGRIVALAGLVAAGCNRQAGPEPITLGHAVPLSGPAQEFGAREREGVLIAVDEANAANPPTLAGRRVHVLHADTGDSADGFQAAGVRLATVNRVAALLGGATAGEAGKRAEASAGS